MRTTSEELIATKTYLAPDDQGGLVARGARFPADHPAVVASPASFTAAPPRDGRMVCLGGVLGPRGMLRRGQTFAEDHEIVKLHPLAFVPSPVDELDLEGLAAAAFHNGAQQRAVRDRDRAAAEEKRNRRREARLRQVEQLETEAAAARAALEGSAV